MKPTNKYHKSHRGVYKDGDFDGKFWIEDMDGEFQRGSIYKDGQVTANLSKSETDDKAGRTSCVTISYPVTTVVDWISRACAGGSCYTQPMYTETKTIWITYVTCGSAPGANPITTTATLFTDDDMTNAWIQQNYLIKAPTKPIANIALTLACFGILSNYNDDSRYDFKFIIYNDEPVNGNRTLVDFSKGRVPGHTFMGLQRTDTQTGTQVRKVMGFYPKVLWQSFLGWNVASTWGDDANSDFDESVTIDVNAEQFYNIISTISGPVGQNTYNIQGGAGGFTGHNCVSMVQKIAYDYLNNIPPGLGLTPFGWMYTPADFGGDIRDYYQALTSQNNVGVSIGAQTSPTSAGYILNR